MTRICGPHAREWSNTELDRRCFLWAATPGLLSRISTVHEGGAANGRPRRVWSQTLSLSFLPCEVTVTEPASLSFCEDCIVIGKMLNPCLARKFCVFAKVDLFVWQELQALAPFPSRLRSLGIKWKCIKMRWDEQTKFVTKGKWKSYPSGLACFCCLRQRFWAGGVHIVLPKGHKMTC